MTESQKMWVALIERMGSEPAARAELARKLRLAADQVEDEGWPLVFGCECQPGDLCQNDNIGHMETVSVTLSYPWGG